MKVFEMRAFTWVITGLLDSGKTTLINRLLKEELSDTNVLVLQFEEGEEPLIQADNVRKLVFYKKELEKEGIYYVKLSGRYMWVTRRE